MVTILFTDGIYLCKNTKKDIQKHQSLKLKNLSDYEKFINSIEVSSPKDTSGSHDIANKWSMYRWAEYLDVNTSEIEKIRDEISSILYFKYLRAKFPIKRSLFAKHKREIQGKGKILYIDDKWEKGWKSIFEHLSLENQDYSLETVEEVYKDKTREEVITFVMEKVKSVDPDVVILDMRLHKDDFLDNVGLSDFTGIQIFNQIKEINPGIQVIIFTASSNSLLLDELYSYGSSILGYVKKEHPKNYNLTTQGNINKLIRLINEGFERKYLKEIWEIQQKILQLNIVQKLSNDYLVSIKTHVESSFYILDSNLEKKIDLAVLAFYNIIEFIIKYYGGSHGSGYSQISDICKKSLEIDGLDIILSKIICTRNYIAHGKDEKEIQYFCKKSTIKNPNSDNILEWFKALETILKRMQIF